MPSSVNCDHRPSPSITVHHHSPPITTVHHHSSPFITIRLPNRRFKSKRLRHGHGLGPGSFVPSWILVILPGELILQVDRTSPPSAAPSVSLPANPRLVPTQPGLKLYWVTSYKLSSSQVARETSPHGSPPRDWPLRKTQEVLQQLLVEDSAYDGSIQMPANLLFRL